MPRRCRRGLGDLQRVERHHGLHDDVRVAIRSSLRDRSSRILVRLEGERELRLREFGTQQRAWAKLLTGKPTSIIRTATLAIKRGKLAEIKSSYSFKGVCETSSDSESQAVAFRLMCGI